MSSQSRILPKRVVSRKSFAILSVPFVVLSVLLFRLLSVSNLQVFASPMGLTNEVLVRGAGKFQVEFWTEGNHSFLRRQFIHSWHKSLRITTFPERKEKYALRVVYFVNCKLNNNYPEWIQGQFPYLPPPVHKNVNFSELYVVATSSNCEKESGLKQSIEDFRRTHNRLKSRATAIFLECHDEPHVDTTEYHGIAKTWELSQSHSGSTDIVAYFHSKGVTRAEHFTEPGVNAPFWNQLDRAIEAYDIFPLIDKIGFSCGGNGWVWYNFWFVRGSYMVTVETPIRSPRRHYFEDWLGRVSDIPNPEGIEREGTVYNSSLRKCYGMRNPDDGLKSYAHMGYHFIPQTNEFRPFEPTA